MNGMNRKLLTNIVLTILRLPALGSIFAILLGICANDVLVFFLMPYRQHLSR